MELGLDQDLKERIANIAIKKGPLFGAVPQSSLTTDEMMQLARVGWVRRDYHDAPVMVAPQSTIDWETLRTRHRDRTLHVVSHKLPEGAPWVGTRQAILEELVASTWEQQEDELRTLLHAFCYASMWNQEGTEGQAIESQETFFFYTERMRNTALKATGYAVEAPEANDQFWEMVNSLSDVPD
nr:hypothetical protein [Sulfobacillus harzensis]